MGSFGLSVPAFGCLRWQVELQTLAMACVLLLSNAATAQPWSSVRRLDLVKPYYQAFVPHSEISSLTVDIGFAGDRVGGNGNNPAPGGPKFAVRQNANGVRTVGRSLQDHANEEVVLSEGTNTISIQRNGGSHRVTGRWAAKLEIEVDVMTGGARIRVSPKFAITGLKRDKWTLKDSTQRYRDISRAVKIGLDAESALPGMRAQLGPLLAAANNPKAAFANAAVAAQKLQVDIKKAEKAVARLSTAAPQLAAMEGLREYSQPVVENGRIAVRIHLNGGLVELDENWQVINVTQPDHLAPRTWRGRQGDKAIEAAFVRREGDQIMLKTKSGKLFKTRLTSLSNADVQWIEKNAAAARQTKGG